MAEDNPSVLSGHCLCGAARFKLVGPHNWVGHCHCESCRRATSSPFTTWIGQPNGSWELTGAVIRSYQSSPETPVDFAAPAAPPLYFKSDRYPDEMHFYAVLLEDPALVNPAEHFHATERVSWLHLADGLPEV